MESNESIEPIFESNKDSPLIKKILVEMVLDNLMKYAFSKRPFLCVVLTQSHD